MQAFLPSAHNTTSFLSCPSSSFVGERGRKKASLLTRARFCHSADIREWVCGWSEYMPYDRAYMERRHEFQLNDKDTKGDDDAKGERKGEGKKHKQKGVVFSAFNDVGDQHFNYFFVPCLSLDNDVILTALVSLILQGVRGEPPETFSVKTKTPPEKGNYRRATLWLSLSF